MRFSAQQQDRLRAVTQAGHDLISGMIMLVKVIGLSVICVGVVAIVHWLITADPDTTAFRDFLLAIQSPVMHNLVLMVGGVIGVPVWVFKMMDRSDRVRYPVAAAGTARSSLHRYSEAGENAAPKGGSRHEQ